jgi:putative flavoprotein involved in K+ transport
MGWFERLAADLPDGIHTGKPNPQLTGGEGGHDISPHSLARDGVILLGQLRAIDSGTAYFASDLAANIAWGDEQAIDLLRSADRIVDDQALQVPVADVPDDLEEAGSRSGRTSAERRYGSSPTELDLRATGVTTVIWATGYRPDLSWVHLPFLDADGYPLHRRGITPVDRFYVLGLDWLHSAKSGLFAGIGDDAGYIASVIARAA